MFEALLDRNNDALALGTVSHEGRDVTWSYSSISRHIRTIAGGLCASWRTSTTAQPVGSSAQPPDDVEGRRHVVVCGSMGFQAIMALVCYHQRYVAVFVPSIAEDILSRMSVIQRACEAFAIVMEDSVWTNLQPHIHARSSELQDCAVLVYASASGKLSQLQQPCAARSTKASLLPAPVDESLPEHASAPSPTTPLYIFHRNDKHTTVTLDHSTVQSYMQQGIASLAHAVDHRQAAAPDPVDARIRIRSYTQLACDAAAVAEHSGSIRASTNRSTSRCMRPEGVTLSGLASTSQCSSGSGTGLPLPTSASLTKCTCGNSPNAPQRDPRVSDQVIPASTCVVCTSCGSGADLASFASSLTSRCGSAGLSSDSCLSVAREAPPHLPPPPPHDMLIEQLLAHADIDVGADLQDDVIQTQQQPAVGPMLKAPESLLSVHDPQASGKPAGPPSTFGRAISTAIPSELYGGITVQPWSGDVLHCGSDAGVDTCIPVEPCTVTRAQPAAQALAHSSRPRPAPLTVDFGIPAQPSWACQGFCTPPRDSSSPTPAPATPELTPSSEIDFGLHTEWYSEPEVTSPVPLGKVMGRLSHFPLSRGPEGCAESDSRVPEGPVASAHIQPCPRSSACLDRWVVQLEDDEVAEEDGVLWELAGLCSRPATREIGLCGQSEGQPEENVEAECLEEAHSLAWKTDAWSDSVREDGGPRISEVRSTIESWQSGISGACCGSGRQPRLLSALPADTPAALLFGLLLPLSMGWHITLPCEERSCGEVLWKALFRDPARTFDAVFMPSACCDELTRLAIEALGGKAPSECVQGATALGAPLATLAACAMFGPAVTPGAVQSFVASMQPFGLRRSAISVVCSTWELPVLCAPLLGLHTLETGLRCAVGDAASPLGSVVIVGGTSRSELPDGTIGNIWVYAGGAASPKTRGIASMPLQWLFDPATCVRSGPYRATGLAGYIENGRVFIIGRYVDIMFAQDSSQHATDIEAALLGNTPSFKMNGFALRVPAAKGASVGLPMFPGTLLPAIRAGGKAESACARPRGSMERGTFWPRLKFSRKAMPNRGQGEVERDIGMKALGAEGLLRGRAAADGEEQDRCAVLMVRRPRQHKQRRLRPLSVFRACIGGPDANSRKHGLEQDEILDSLMMIKNAWGVHVKEVWAMDSDLPLTPMGNVDRSAALAPCGLVDVFDVDERRGVLRARMGGHAALV
eukprot:jgi/Ulvmu1/4041/UM019_0018.1